tara:strand:- start:246 stop:587 length:342 start_codon:yes stop_codon:yes gene_type:complete
MIVDAGRILMAAYLKTTFTTAKVGTGGNSTSPLADNLDVPIYNVATTERTSSGSNVVDFKFTITGASLLGNTIRELAIFSADGNTMLTRISFDGIGPFNSGEEVDFYVTIEVE